MTSPALEDERYLPDMLQALVAPKNDPFEFNKLFLALDSKEFVPLVKGDENRIFDARELRTQLGSIREGPASILEVMVALAVRCEESIMTNPNYGDRTSQWFWEMVSSLGLNGQTDEKFDSEYTDRVLDIFLERDYEPNGKGGLFYLPNCPEDLRYIEVWVQLLWYLDTIV